MMPTSSIPEIRRNLYSSRQNTLELIAKVDAEMAIRRPRPTAWSVKDHVAHLIAVEESILHFARRILNEDRPISPLCYDTAFNHDRWNNHKINEKADYTWEETVSTLAETRKELLDLLEDVPDEALNRLGSHPVWGEPVMLASILRIPYRHERGHRDEIMALCNRLTESDS